MRGMKAIHGYAVVTSVLVVLLGYQNYDLKHSFLVVKTDLGAVEPVPLGNDPVYGPDAAPVTVVCYSDFACPPCADLYPTLNRLTETFAGRVRVVYKHVAGSETAGTAVAAALAAERQGAYWAMCGALYDAQRDLAEAPYARLAADLGLDPDLLQHDMENVPYRDLVTTNTREARALAVDGTPTVFVNGLRMESHRYARLKSVVRRLLDELPAEPRS